MYVFIVLINIYSAYILYASNAGVRCTADSANTTIIIQ